MSVLIACLFLCGLLLVLSQFRSTLTLGRPSSSAGPFVLLHSPGTVSQAREPDSPSGVLTGAVQRLRGDLRVAGRLQARPWLLAARAMAPREANTLSP